MTPADGSAAKRKRSTPDASAASGAAQEATSDSGEICADLPDGVARLIDVGGQGEGGWLALNFANAR
eukprot:2920788-Alexandrium_andersonii.AAC.1